MPIRTFARAATPTTTPTTDEDLLDLRQAAQRLGMSPLTLKRMAQRGEIPSVKFRKLRRFEPSVLRAYIAKHRLG